MKAAFAHFDACVHHGPGAAAKMLQRAAGVTPDGDIGPATIKAINTLCSTAPDVFVKLMLAERRRYLSAIVRNKPSQQKFIVGWMNRCDDVQKTLKEMQ